VIEGVQPGGPTRLLGVHDPAQVVVIDAALLAELEASTNTGTWAVSLIDDRVEWSEGMYRIYGTDPESFRPTPAAVSALLHRDDLDRLIAQTQSWQAGSGPFAFVHRVVRPDGAVRMVEARGWVVFDQAGEPEWALGTAQDITEAVAEADERVRLHSRRLTTLEELSSAEERERARIAGDIHDDTIQALDAVSLELERTLSGMPQDAARASVERCYRDVRSATERLRRLMFSMMSPPAGLNLPEAAEWFCATALGRIGIAYEVEVAEGLGRIGEQRVILAYRLLQEAVRNVVKHAKASRVLVTIARGPDEELIVRVLDDGIGTGGAGVVGTSHAGLRLIRERAAAAGGEAHIGPGLDGRGMSVEFTIPPTPEPRR
jgi:PAS domain S-box-containing protein